MIESSRPILKIPKTMSEKIMDVLSILLLVGMYVFIIFSWNELPDRVPAHFNAAGEPDRWGGKGSVLVLPIVATFLLKTTMILNKFPHIFNYPVEVTKENAEPLYVTSRKMLSTLNLFIMFFFTIGVWETVQVAFGKAGLGMWYLPGLLLSIFGTIGFYLNRLIRLGKKNKS
ncbi:DUF1648 domain-containing protein [Fredinandcohnia humi]